MGVGGVSDGVVTVIGEDVFFLLKTQKKKTCYSLHTLIHYILSFYLVLIGKFENSKNKTVDIHIHLKGQKSEKTSFQKC